ncbi:MAG: shikimate kinase [Bacteroides sp.]|nr:shikimate kinase [Bacteroides sp.]MCM1457235.1 shikimate kinase [Lachnoclostridium sp.]
MRPIFLIGFMCSGKTTLGQALARRLGMRFIDLDQAIEERAGMSVAEIFHTLGEDRFRSLEAEAVDEMCRLTDTIVATGGGTPCRPGMMQRLNAAGLTVALHAAPGRLYPRLMLGRQSRPLLAEARDEEALRGIVEPLLSERQQFYDMAAVRFDSSLLETEEEIAASVDRFIATPAFKAEYPNQQT